MTQHGNIDFGLANKIASENQLLNEEKWIIEALKKIKEQRHSLEVEKLHLISLRTRCTSKSNTNEVPTTCNDFNVNSIEPIPVTRINMDLPYVRDDDIFCNGEELNLTVSNHFIQTDGDMDMEEYEDDDAEDDDYDIDMNMFMNGEDNVKKTKKN